MAEIQIAAMQTVVPTKPTSPTTSYKLILLFPHQSDTLLSLPISTPAFHSVLFFHKASPTDSGWFHAALIKESLSLALVDQPILAGRLRISSLDDVEIVSNDSGVRLVEAKLDITAKEAIDQLQKLVFWEDFNQQNAQFSPLFYVQVTNFSCGGYSLGLSSSFLLMDPFVATSFLKNWITIHQSLVSSNNDSKFPMFYHPHLTRSAPLLSSDLQSNTNRKPGSDSVTFTIPARDSDFKDLATSCVIMAEREVGRRMSDEFWILNKMSPESDGEIVLVKRSEKGSIDGGGIGLTVSWDKLGLENVCLNRGEKPDHAFCWISSSSEEGCVFISPASDEIKLVVSFP